MSSTLVDIFSLVKPWVSVVDAIEVMEGSGPSSGRVRHLGFVAASTDGVALDAVLARVVGLDPEQIPTTREAVKRGLGEAAMDKIWLRGCDLDQVVVSDFQVPANWKFFLIPSVLSRLLARFVWVRPVISGSSCVGCGECVKMCAAQAIRLVSDLAVINQHLCTSCLCCLEGCPEGAVETKLSWLARMVR
jgi:ferredoxin